MVKLQNYTIKKNKRNIFSFFFTGHLHQDTSFCQTAGKFRKALQPLVCKFVVSDKHTDSAFSFKFPLFVQRETFFLHNLCPVQQMLLPRSGFFTTRETHACETSSCQDINSVTQHTVTVLTLRSKLELQSVFRRVCWVAVPDCGSLMWFHSLMLLRWRRLLLPLLTFSAPASECAFDFYLQVAPNKDVPAPGLNKERKSAWLVARFLSSHWAATNTLYQSW